MDFSVKPVSLEQWLPGPQQLDLQISELRGGRVPDGPGPVTTASYKCPGWLVTGFTTLFPVDRVDLSCLGPRPHLQSVLPLNLSLASWAVIVL